MPSKEKLSKQRQPMSKEKRSREKFHLSKERQARASVENRQVSRGKQVQWPRKAPHVRFPSRNLYYFHGKLGSFWTKFDIF